MSSALRQPRLRFVPLRREDLKTLCLSRAGLSESQKAVFTRACDSVEHAFRDEFHQIRQQLKNAYAPLDPDADTVTIAGTVASTTNAGGLATLLETILSRANYDRVTEEELQTAFLSASLFDIRLHVDMTEFADVLLYTRGASIKEEKVPRFLNLWPKMIRFTNYDRVVLYLRFREDLDSDSTLGGCRPGSTMLKLFQNVPDADLEMLFPNTRVGMRTIDKLLIGVPALVSGGIVLTTKLGTTLVLLGSLLGFWLGLHRDEVQLNKATLLALAAGVGALGGYIWKQISSFRNRKLRFTQALTQSLYFKLLDNNAGVLFRLLDDAEDSECKESMLAYCFLLQAGRPLSCEELDSTIETWLERECHTKLDFEIGDALAKLERLGHAVQDQGCWSLLPARTDQLSG